MCLRPVWFMALLIPVAQTFLSFHIRDLHSKHSARGAPRVYIDDIMTLFDHHKLSIIAFYLSRCLVGSCVRWRTISSLRRLCDRKTRRHMLDVMRNVDRPVSPTPLLWSKIIVTG